MQVATVDPSVSEEATVRVRRRHRLFAVPSGLLLFVCMFLPIVQNCGEPVYPCQVLPAWLPHVLGLVVAVRALANRPLRVSALRAARRWAAVAIGFWVIAAAWFATWTFTADAMVGAPLGLACAAWLAVAAIVRWRDLPVAAAADRSALPRAQLGAVRGGAARPATLLFVLMLVTFAIAAASRPARVRPEGHGDIDLSGLYRC